MKLIVPQRRLGPKRLLACAIAVYLIQILAIDMYAPALPSMQVELGVSPAVLNSTVFSFLIASTVTMLLAGSISDRFGRQRTFLAGSILFTVGSFGCTVAPGVGALTAWRVVEALGMGTCATVSSALIKDSFAGDDLKLAMTLLQSLIIIGPVAAPFLGSFAVEHVGWRGVFALLTAGGVLCCVLSALISETYHASNATLTTAFGSMLSIARALMGQPGFGALALFVGITGIPFFAFIATASYILIDGFGLSYTGYSIVYAATCAVNLIAPAVYLKLQKRFDVPAILLICIVLVGCATALLAAFGMRSPVGLFCGFAPYALAEGIVRPAAYLVLLDQPEERVGTASAFANFAYGAITAAATVAATLPWPSFTLALIALTAGCAITLAALYTQGHKNWKMRSDN
jgi:DHA1 family bicyclomycin/chloramphenicol resistance-like MFS transporter